MVNTGIKYFSFFFSGEAYKIKDIESVKSDLIRLFPNDKNTIKKFVLGEELLIKDNLDFEGVVNYIKVFKESAIGYKITISDGGKEDEAFISKDRSDKRAVELVMELKKAEEIMKEVKREINNNDSVTEGTKDSLLNQMKLLKYKTEDMELHPYGSTIEAEIIKESYGIMNEGDQLLNSIKMVFGNG